MNILKCLGLCAWLALAACSSRPSQPDWQIEARGSTERFVTAYLSGGRAADAEWLRTRQSLASTAEPQQLARAELLRCALQVASLDWQPRCEGFEPWRSSASAAERAYADHLLGRRPEKEMDLPLAQQRVASQGAAALPGLEDPLSRLLGAAVLLRSGRVPPQEQGSLIQRAVDTASAQGWRRPLRAWLGLQLGQAQAAGRSEEVVRIRQRLAVLEDSP